MRKTFPIIPAALVLLVLLCLIGGIRNYNALLNSDQYSYLIYGRALARGGFTMEYFLRDILRDRLPEGSSRPLFYGRRYYSDGEVISHLEPGFSLLLAAAIRIGGQPAAFGVNVVLLAVFLIAYFLVLRSEAPAGKLAALAAVFLVLGWDDHVTVGYSLQLMRDIPPLAFYWTGLGLILAGLRRPGRLLFFVLGGSAALAVSGLVRLTNLVIILPLAVYALVALRLRGMSWPRIVLWTAAPAAVFCLVFIPQFLEEAFHFGAPLSFARRSLRAFAGFFNGSPSGSVHSFSLENLRNNLPRNLSSIYNVLTLPGVVCLAAGIYACRRRLSTWLIMLPTPLLHLLLFSAWGHRARRYRFPVYPFAAYLIASGVLWILARWPVFEKRSPAGVRIVIAVSIALVSAAAAAGRLIGGPGLDYAGIFFISLLLAALLPLWAGNRPSRANAPGAVFTAGAGLLLLPFFWSLSTQRWNFSWSDAQRLRREIEQRVPPDAVILGQRYLIQNVDFYTHAHGISPGNLAAALGTDVAEAVAVVEEHGHPVFALDNRGVRSMGEDLIELRRYFDLEPVAEWRSSDFKLDHPHYSDGEKLTLFRVARRREQKRIMTLDTPQTGDYLLLIDTGFPPLPGRRPGETVVRVNGREVPADLADGLNYLLVEAGDVSVPETVLEVEYDRPLPARPLRALLPVENRFRLDFGVDRDPDDGLFVVRGLYLGRARRRHYRVMGPEAALLLPRLVPPASGGWLELRVRNMLPQPIPLTISVRPGEGAVSGRGIPAGGEWRTVRFPLPPLSPRQGSLVLTVAAEPARVAPEERESLTGAAFLAIDWVEIGWGEGDAEIPDE